MEATATSNPFAEVLNATGTPLRCEEEMLREQTHQDIRSHDNGSLTRNEESTTLKSRMRRTASDAFRPSKSKVYNKRRASLQDRVHLLATTFGGGDSLFEKAIYQPDPTDLDVGRHQSNFLEYYAFGVDYAVLNGELRPNLVDMQPPTIVDVFSMSGSSSEINDIAGYVFPSGVELKLVPNNSIHQVCAPHRDAYQILQFSDGKGIPTYGCCIIITDVVETIAEDALSYLRENLSMSRASNTIKRALRRVVRGNAIRRRASSKSSDPLWKVLPVSRGDVSESVDPNSNMSPAAPQLSTISNYLFKRGSVTTLNSTSSTAPTAAPSVPPSSSSFFNGWSGFMPFSSSKSSKADEGSAEGSATDCVDEYLRLLTSATSDNDDDDDDDNSTWALDRDVHGFSKEYVGNDGDGSDAVDAAHVDVNVCHALVRSRARRSSGLFLVHDPKALASMVPMAEGIATDHRESQGVASTPPELDKRVGKADGVDAAEEPRESQWVPVHQRAFCLISRRPNHSFMFKVTYAYCTCIDFTSQIQLSTFPSTSPPPPTH